MPLGVSIDFEHICHTPAYKQLDRDQTINLDIPTITKEILALLGRNGITTTFFVVSELAQKHPALIQEMVSQGHEIASHSVTHPSLLSLETPEIKTEIFESKRTLERISGTDVTGFRAPTCQISDQVYNILAEAGYEYSSSVMPSIPLPGFYSDKYSFERPTEVVTENGCVIEYPLAVHPVFKIPISGAWTRLLGRRFFLSSIKNLLNRKESVLTYVHPWEFVRLQDTPLPVRNRLRTGDWVKDTYQRLLALDHEFATTKEFLNITPPRNEYIIST